MAVLFPYTLDICVHILYIHCICVYGHNIQIHATVYAIHGYRCMLYICVCRDTVRMHYVYLCGHYIHEMDIYVCFCIMCRHYMDVYVRI